MRGLTTAVIAVVTAFLMAGIAAAANHEASVENGKALFNDPKLGSSGKTCNDCHRGGKGLKKAAGRKDLEAVVNACVTGPLAGKALEPESIEMKSLLLYINSLKKPPLGC